MMTLHEKLTKKCERYFLPFTRNIHCRVKISDKTHKEIASILSRISDKWEVTVDNNFIKLKIILPSKVSEMKERLLYHFNRERDRRKKQSKRDLVELMIKNRFTIVDIINSVYNEDVDKIFGSEENYEIIGRLYNNEDK